MTNLLQQLVLTQNMNSWFQCNKSFAEWEKCTVVSLFHQGHMYSGWKWGS